MPAHEPRQTLQRFLGLLLGHGVAGSHVPRAAEAEGRAGQHCLSPECYTIKRPSGVYSSPNASDTAS